ncbi:MAG TPA: adenylate/guanylate cyclase domain-containing protein [Candidatus Limnocylindria bacterium]|jgi:adenylate cyclase|nr:adenylate/guanylate cyclase domain-containing protein [Candidatus Limnocylindria bacterium]
MEASEARAPSVPATPSGFRITVTHLGRTEVREIGGESVVIGRAKDGLAPDLDLDPDKNVSRRHARIWREGDRVCIEDTGSRGGTRVNQALLSPGGRTELASGSTIRLGETVLVVEFSPTRAGGTGNRPAPSVPAPTPAPVPASPFSEPSGSDSDVEICASLEASSPVFSGSQKNSELASRLSPILSLVSAEAAEAPFETTLHQIVQEALKVIPGAVRGAFMLYHPPTDSLLLSAYVAEGEPSVSETLARQALREKRGFVWRKGATGEDLMASIVRLQIHSGMYVPVIWKGLSQGVLCVDNQHQNHAFTDDDLRTLTGIANHVSLLLALRQIQEELGFKSKLLDRVLMNFSPQIRQKLLAKARAGKLRPGGEKSEVTILFSDMRGFTAMSAKMDADDVLNLVNDYLPVLSEGIFKHDGTIDKFLGDAILAVFGSPDPDLQQHEKAVRAGLAMQEAVRKLNVERAARGDVTVEVGIGIHCGVVLHGFIGTEQRLEFTVIGDAVNRANRFCNGAKGGEVLISAEVFQRTFKNVQAEKLSISTKHEGDLTAYRVKGMRAP